MLIKLKQGDCLEVLKKAPDNYADSLVTDPPAGIAFMGKAWDTDKGGRDAWVEWLTSIMREALRVLKPGAHGLVWALPRTSHWTATALEDAGFEVRDIVTHLFGTGFPKSLDVSKAIQKVEPDTAKQWEGWGTALKPASEHWILVRKTLGEKTVAANVLKHGTGGINIDASRIGVEQSAIGRFPANLLLDEKAAALLDEQSGVRPGDSLNRKPRKNTAASGGEIFKSTIDWETTGHADHGGASRFFYCAKASKSDKGADNTHPTVKSSTLMTYLITLVTPPNGVVLDPFMGSGSTGVSAVRAGFGFVGIEKETEYFTIAESRINACKLKEGA